ncbi:MAG: phosphoribosylglycinamide formyltransferase [Phycisphaerales bacterium]|nr:phosphoribosylglycinamide formyltransferase [Phycisphaerales bacterium]
MGDALRVLALASGGGRTILNLAGRSMAGELPGIDLQHVGVSNSHCAAIERCRQSGLDVHVPDGDPDAMVADLFESVQPDMVLLCGYLRHLQIPEALRHRVMNIHPSLLPAFGGKGMYGDHVHAAVIDSSEANSGCTVHLVDEVYDNGPIVLQKQCAVYTDDTKDTLADRVFALECEALPEAVLLAAEGRLRLDDNQVCIAEQGETWSDALFSRR